MSSEFAQSAGIYGSDLLNQHSGGLTGDFSFGAERCGSSASGGWGNNDHGSGQELVGLDDHTVTVSVLLVTYALGNLESVDVTAEHVVLPLAQRQPAFLRGRPRRLPGRRPQPLVLCSDAGAGLRSAGQYEWPQIDSAPSLRGCVG